MIWPAFVNRAAASSRERHENFGRLHSRQAQEQRDAQAALATIDRAEIRGLVAAFHLSVAGLPAH